MFSSLQGFWETWPQLLFDLFLYFVCVTVYSFVVIVKAKHTPTHTCRHIKDVLPHPLNACLSNHTYHFKPTHPPPHPPTHTRHSRSSAICLTVYQALICLLSQLHQTKHTSVTSPNFSTLFNTPLLIFLHSFPLFLNFLSLLCATSFPYFWAEINFVRWRPWKLALHRQKLPDVDLTVSFSQ